MPGTDVIQENRLVETFFDLVRIYSPSKAERAAGDYVRAILDKLGFEYHEDTAAERIGGDTGNLILRVDGDSGLGPTLLLSCHLDTVEPAEGTEPVIEGRTIRSKGETILGSDDKAPVAILLETLRIIREQNLKAPPLEFVFSVAEEIGLQGAGALESGVLQSKCGFVLDSEHPVGDFVTRAPSHTVYAAEFHGRAAHAGIEPELGVSAINMASQAVGLVPKGRIDDETTANVGTIEGGLATNIVPERCRMTGEARSHNPETLKELLKQIRSTLEEAARNAGGKVQYEEIPQYVTYRVPDNSTTVARAVEAARNLGLAGNLVSSGGGSDANVFNSKGIPTIVLGVNFKDVHSTNERITIDDMTMNTRLVLGIITGEVF